MVEEGPGVMERSMNPRGYGGTRAEVDAKPRRDDMAGAGTKEQGPLPPLLLTLTVVTGVVDAVSILARGVIPGVQVSWGRTSAPRSRT